MTSSAGIEIRSGGRQRWSPPRADAACPARPLPAIRPCRRTSSAPGHAEPRPPGRSAGWSPPPRLLGRPPGRGVNQLGAAAIVGSALRRPLRFHAEDPNIVFGQLTWHLTKSLPRHTAAPAHAHRRAQKVKASPMVDSAPAHAAAARCPIGRPPAGLVRRSLSTGRVVFLVIAAAAPLAAMVGNVPLGADRRQRGRASGRLSDRPWSCSASPSATRR